MTLQVEGLLGQGRVAAQRLMVDTCTISRTTADTVAANGDTTPTVVEVYDGPCRLRPRATEDRMVEVQGDDVGVAAFVVSLPITATGIQPGDRVEITASALDPDAVGRTLTVLGAITGSQITARRLGCMEVR
jgi:hypothetical protein